MLLGQNMIKEYTCLPQSLAAAQSLQSLDLGSSRTAPRLLVTDKPSNTSTYKQIIKIVYHLKTEVLKTGSTRYSGQNNTKNA